MAVVLLLQSADVVRIQSIENSAAVSVLVLNHITGGVLNGVLHGAGLGCHIVAHAINGSLGGAAAICNLVGQGVDASLSVVAVLEDSGVYAVKALAQGLLDASLTQSEVVQVGQDSGIVEACGKISLSGRSAAAGIAIAAALTATKATAEAVATTTPTKQEQNDQPSRNHRHCCPLPHAGRQGTFQK